MEFGLNAQAHAPQNSNSRLSFRLFVTFKPRLTLGSEVFGDFDVKSKIRTIRRIGPALDLLKQERMALIERFFDTLFLIVERR